MIRFISRAAVSCCFILLLFSSACTKNPKVVETERVKECVQQNIVTESAYQKNPKLAGLDAKVNCSKYYTSNLPDTEEEQIARYFELQEVAGKTANKKSPYIYMLYSGEFRNALHSYNKCLTAGDPFQVCGRDTRRLILSCMPKMDSYLNHEFPNCTGPQPEERKEALWNYSEAYIKNYLAEKGRLSNSLLRNR